MTHIDRQRRRLLASAVAATAATWTSFPVHAATRGFDPDFGTATDALAALRRRRISSVELTRHVLDRIRRHDGRLHAFITLLEESALARAREADRELARGGQARPLLGLPVLVKDVFLTAGVRTTSGSKQLADHVPSTSAVVVERIEAAGAVILGKTSTPEFAGDVQTFNELAGTTANPWDAARTSGGSTGGAAALAAGLGFLEVGSDIGGSIRIPASFCGVYGHKPTIGLVPLEGHVPPPLGTLLDDEILPVAGPLARSAQDLALHLQVLGGPSGDRARALRWTLPPPRRRSLREYRIGFVLDDPLCPVDAPVQRVLATAIDALRAAGVQLTEGWPKGFDPRASHDDYFFLLATTQEAASPEAAIEEFRKAIAAGVEHPYLRGAVATHREWAARNQQRLRAQATWREYFRDHDAFLSPVAFVAAFAHDHGPRRERQIATAAGPRPYDDIYGWISQATLTGCPATAAPVGRTAEGLPAGLQIMGPYMEDATPLDIAARMAEVIGGFEAPPGFG
jgi:amidase